MVFDPTPRVNSLYGPNSTMFWTDAQRSRALDILWRNPNTPDWKGYNAYWRTQAPVDESGNVGRVGKLKQVVDDSGNLLSGSNKRTVYDVETKSGLRYTTYDPTGATHYTVGGGMMFGGKMIPSNDQSQSPEKTNTEKQNQAEVAASIQQSIHPPLLPRLTGLPPPAQMQNALQTPSNTRPEMQLMGRFGAKHDMNPRHHNSGFRFPSVNDIFSFPQMPKPQKHILSKRTDLTAYTKTTAKQITPSRVDVRIATRAKSPVRLLEYQNPKHFEIVMGGNFYKRHKNEPSVLKGVIGHEIAHIKHPFDHAGNFAGICKSLGVPKRYRNRK